MTEEERQAHALRLEALRGKLEKRRDEPGFAANVAELEQRIAEIEALLVVVEPEPEPPVEEPPVEPEAPPEEPQPGDETLSGGA